MALVEIVGLQIFLGFFQLLPRAFGEKADCSEACLVVHALRGIGKSLVNAGIGVPFFQIGIEALLSFLKKSLLCLQAHLFR